MHMGNMGVIGIQGPANLKHILINNGAHDSVGGQPSAAGSENFSFPEIALACGYKHVSESKCGFVWSHVEIRSGLFYINPFINSNKMGSSTFHFAVSN